MRKMKSGNLILKTALLAGLAGLYGCSDGDDTTINIGGGTTAPGGGGSGVISANCPSWASAREQDSAGTDVCQLPGEILEDRTLTSDIVWYMDGRITVGNGNREMSLTEGVLENGADVLDVTLTIEAGTEIKARAGSFGNLLITRGATINAVGTAADPIIMSSDDDGYDGSGEWGGLIVHGYGLHNECLTADAGVVACNVDSEGESGFGGGYTADDSSGVISYVIVTEGGYEFAPGNEINGVSLIGVGSGTQMDHIQVNANADDGIEFYGGNVNVSHLVLTGNLDDSVDWDEGYQGNLQYVLVVQDPATEGNAIEADTEGTLDFLSMPTIANATFVGDGANDELWVFKKASGGYLLNTIGAVAAGNGTIVNCVLVDGAGAEANVGTTLVMNNVISGCTSFGNTNLGATGVIEVAPGLDASYAAQDAAASGVALDVAGFNSTYGQSTADPAYLEATNYIGAVDPAASAPFWYSDWTLEGTL